MKTRTIATAATLALAAGALAGCSSIQDKVEERLAEELVEQAIGDGTEVNQDEGTITLKDDDGSELTIDTDQELPEDFPSSMPLPSQYTVAQAMRMSNGDGLILSVVLTTELEFDAVKAELSGALESSPWVPKSDPTEVMMGEMESWSHMLELDGLEAMVTVGAMQDDISVTYYMERSPEEE
ncbi:MAG: hypothetical protein GX593_12950 [Actinomycetales bacterium]|nr:hypothetical protein [Actinomycetales bacterium]